MEYFWYTKFTIPDGHGFALFGPQHLAWLAAAAAVCLVMGRLYSRWDERARARCRLAVGVLLLADELFKDVASLATGQFRLDFLPFHLCSINIFVVWADILRPGPAKKEVLYAACLPGAVAALLFPSWTKTPVWNFMALHSFTVHILLLLYPALLLAGGFRPRFANLRRAAAPAALCVAGVFALNKLLGTNFMFLNGAGEGNPLTLFEQWLGDPGYLAAYPFLIALVWAVLYLPWGACAPARKRKKRPRAERRARQKIPGVPFPGRPRRSYSISHCILFHFAGPPPMGNAGDFFYFSTACAAPAASSSMRAAGAGPGAHASITRSKWFCRVSLRRARAEPCTGATHRPARPASSSRAA